MRHTFRCSICCKVLCISQLRVEDPDGSLVCAHCVPDYKPPEERARQTFRCSTCDKVKDLAWLWETEPDGHMLCATCVSAAERMGEQLEAEFQAMHDDAAFWEER